jgi:hypothetical protein
MSNQGSKQSWIGIRYTHLRGRDGEEPEGHQADRANSEAPACIPSLRLPIWWKAHIRGHGPGGEVISGSHRVREAGY